jgi:hypothetical protein
LIADTLARTRRKDNRKHIDREKGNFLRLFTVGGIIKNPAFIEQHRHHLTIEQTKAVPSIVRISIHKEHQQHDIGHYEKNYRLSIQLQKEKKV